MTRGFLKAHKADFVFSSGNDYNRIEMRRMSMLRLLAPHVFVVLLLGALSWAGTKGALPFLDAKEAAAASMPEPQPLQTPKSAPSEDKQSKDEQAKDEQAKAKQAKDKPTSTGDSGKMTLEELKEAIEHKISPPQGAQGYWQPIPYTDHEVPNAMGPPEMSCKEALGLVPDKPPPPTRPKRPRETEPTPAMEQLAQITVGEDAYDPAQLPGANPEELPPQLLEGKPEDLARVGKVMRRMKQGERIRMSFFGASHTGGDWFTGHLRRVLQGRHGDLGHGFIMPAALYKGYRGTDINLCRTDEWFPDWVGKRDGRDDGLLGFTGMSVSSQDPDQFGWIETTHSNKRGRSVGYYDIWTVAYPDGGTLLVRIDDADPIIEIPTRAASPTLLRTRIRVPEGPHRISMSPAGNGETRIVGVFTEREGPGVLVDAIGIRGRTAKTWLSWNEEMHGRGLATLDPDLVALAYGTNEANAMRYTTDAYRKDLRAVLARIRKALPDAACVLLGPSDRGVKVKGKDDTFAVWDRTEPFAQVQREVAAEYGCVFWDWQQASGGPGSMLAWRFHDPKLAAGDLIHFTKAGYELSAERFLEALEHAQANNR